VKLSKGLAEQEETIIAQLTNIQGKVADIGGYYLPDPAKLDQVMRPSRVFNELLASLS
jgi:isocitrate dehydrogenase